MQWGCSVHNVTDGPGVLISMKCRVSPELVGPPNKTRCAGVPLLGCWVLCLRSLCEIAHPYRDHLCARTQGVFLFSLHRIVFLLFINVPTPSNTDHQWFVPNFSFDMPRKWTFQYECHYAGALSSSPSGLVVAMPDICWHNVVRCLQGKSNWCFRLVFFLKGG